MKKETIEVALSNLDESLIIEADLEGSKQESKNSAPKWKATLYKATGVAAVFFICVIILSFASVCTAAASGVTEAYDLIYAFNPGLAQMLVPVNMYCEYNQIRMSVESVYVHDDTAEVYLSMEDLTGNRIDGTVDLFDSYYINSPYDAIGTCNLVSYDEETRKAYFTILVQNMHNEPISNGKMTFGVKEFLHGKTETACLLDNIDLSSIPDVVELNTDISVCGGSPDAERSAIVPKEEQKFSPTPGVTITGYGVYEDRLHVQVLYDRVCETDNHGWLLLTDKDGNKLMPVEDISFWADNHMDSYNEYVFDIPGDGLDSYQVYGEFTTCNGLVQGDWQVTFPVKVSE